MEMLPNQALKLTRREDPLPLFYYLIEEEKRLKTSID
jgi:hypothetical protein